MLRVSADSISDYYCHCSVDSVPLSQISKLFTQLFSCTTGRCKGALQKAEASEQVTLAGRNLQQDLAQMWGKYHTRETKSSLKQ